MDPKGSKGLNRQHARTSGSRQRNSSADESVVAPCTGPCSWAAILLMPALATAWTAWRKFALPIPPAPLPLTLTGLGALVVNLTCALTLTRVRHAGGSLSRATFLSARNDVLANLAIIGAGGLTLLWPSAWPDLLVGLGIFVLNLDAAREVYITARAEQRTVDTEPA